MKPVSFAGWLGMQVDRDDPVGDLARDVALDRESGNPQLPSFDADRVTWERYFYRGSRGDRDVMTAFFKAYAEYEIHYPEDWTP